MLHDFYDTDPKRGFYGGGGIDARFCGYPLGFALGGVVGGLPPSAPTWGAEYKRLLPESYSRTMVAASHTTSLPLETNAVSLDPTIKDAWGLPAIRFTYRITLMTWRHRASCRGKVWRFSKQPAPNTPGRSR